MGIRFSGITPLTPPKKQRLWNLKVIGVFQNVYLLCSIQIVFLGSHEGLDPTNFEA